MPKTTKAVSESFRHYCQTLSELLLSVQVIDYHQAVLAFDEAASQVVDMILSAKAASRKVMIIGNGGSASIASHIQSDLCKAVGVRAMVFNEIPLLTAFSNDHGYGCVFERPVDLWAESGDLLLAISSSGQSENILRAARSAEARRCQVVTFSGFRVDNPLRRMGRLNFYVPSQSYGFVELVHSVLMHFLADVALASQITQGGLS